ncbi:phosphatidylserine decarboxylase [Candidatus Latescibacterota bacterium]
MMKIDPDGYKVAGITLLLDIIAYFVLYQTAFSLYVWITFGLLSVLIFSVSFFRDPVRRGPEDVNVVISAADGVVKDVSEVGSEGFDGGKALRIAVLMNVFNVHVNRTPVSGTVLNTRHQPGRKLSVYNDRAEYENEYGDTDLETPSGLVRIRQIAGLVARRVVTRVKRGDSLERGDKIGLIRFGSRVDVFLPLIYEPVAVVGEKVHAGESVIAKLNAPSVQNPGGVNVEENENN